MSSERIGRNAPEPPPAESEETACWDFFLHQFRFAMMDKPEMRQDIIERDRHGAEKYGTRLRPHNGRDPEVDLYQELLDAIVYAVQAFQEDPGNEGFHTNRILKLVNEAEESRKRISPNSMLDSSEDQEQTRASWWRSLKRGDLFFAPPQKVIGITEGLEERWNVLAADFNNGKPWCLLASRCIHQSDNLKITENRHFLLNDIRRCRPCEGDPRVTRAIVYLARSSGTRGGR